jgi:hypothetical protein
VTHNTEFVINAHQQNEWVLSAFAVHEDIELLVRRLRTCLQEPLMLGWVSGYTDVLSQYRRNLIVANERRHAKQDERIPLEPARLDAAKNLLLGMRNTDDLLTVGNNVLRDLEDDLQIVTEWVLGQACQPDIMDDAEEGEVDDAQGLLLGIRINSAKRTVTRDGFREFVVDLSKHPDVWDLFELVFLKPPITKPAVMNRLFLSTEAAKKLRQRFNSVFSTLNLRLTLDPWKLEEEKPD